MSQIARIELYHVAAPLPARFYTIDEKALHKHGKRFFVMDRKRLIWFSLRTRGISVSREIDRVRRQSRARR